MRGAQHRASGKAAVCMGHPVVLGAVQAARPAQSFGRQILSDLTSDSFHPTLAQEGNVACL